MDSANLLTAVAAAEPNAKPREKADRAAVQVPVGNFSALMKRLRNDSAFAFDMLCDHTAIDWSEQGSFELVYQLYSTVHGHYLMVTTSVPRVNPIVPTVREYWRIAEFQEREVYDMFGVLYDGHPDLRRLFLEDDWKGFPLRKDYKDEFMLERPE